MEIRESVRDYILEEFLPGTKRAELTDSTPLITGAILDSLATLRLVGFIEERFGVELAAHEASVDHLDTIQDIEALVRSKLEPTSNT
jgi:acyl carrier protein